MSERLAHILSVLPSQDLEVKTQKLPEIDLDTVPMMEMPEDLDGLAEYTFPKFAATYFQKSASHTHIQKLLRYPLLHHENNTDHMVPAAHWFYEAQTHFLAPGPKSELWFRGNKQRVQVTMGSSAGITHPFCSFSRQL